MTHPVDRLDKRLMCHWPSVAWHVVRCRFCHAAVRSVLQEVADELLRDKTYDADNMIELVKSVADDVHNKLKNS